MCVLILGVLFFSLLILFKSALAWILFVNCEDDFEMCATPE